jgi:hypothetical protein
MSVAGREEALWDDRLIVCSSGPLFTHDAQRSCIGCASIEKVAENQWQSADRRGIVSSRDRTHTKSVRGSAPIDANAINLAVFECGELGSDGLLATHVRSHRTVAARRHPARRVTRAPGICRATRRNAVADDGARTSTRALDSLKAMPGVADKFQGGAQCPDLSDSYPQVVDDAPGIGASTLVDGDHPQL